MTAVDRLWFLADEAERRAEEVYHDLGEHHGEVMEPELERRVGRRHFRRAVRRGSETGAAYGAHAVVYRPSGELLLVRHTGVDKWVLPGGEVDPEESFREAVRREVREEAGVAVEFDGLAMLMRVDIRYEDHTTWGVVPVYAAEAETYDPTVDDPEGEIADARWFEELPPDTRDRQHIRKWRRRNLE